MEHLLLTTAVAASFPLAFAAARLTLGMLLRAMQSNRN